MTIEATPKNIEWLTDRLYDLRRTLEAGDGGDLDTHLPTFVLLTKGMEDRHKVENLLYRYFYKKYGVGAAPSTIRATTESSSLTAFVLPEAGVRVVLMDV